MELNSAAAVREVDAVPLIVVVKGVLVDLHPVMAAAPLPSTQNKAVPLQHLF